VDGYCQHTFTEDPKDLDYLKGRGIINSQSLADYGTDFENGNLKNILPEDRRS